MKLLVSKSSKKNRKRHGKKGARYWVLSAISTGAIIAVTIGSSHRMVVGYAESRDGRLEMVSMREDKVSTIDFNIAAGPLGDVLEAMEKAVQPMRNFTGYFFRQPVHAFVGRAQRTRSAERVEVRAMRLPWPMLSA